MSAQRLNPKSTRRIERSVGLPIKRAWSHGGYVFAFVTDDHRHGFWDKKDQTWEWDDAPVHYSSCSEMFPGWNGNTELQAKLAGVATVLEGRAELVRGDS